MIDADQEYIYLGDVGHNQFDISTDTDQEYIQFARKTQLLGYIN